MSLGQMCRRDVVTVKPDTMVSEVAKIMEDNNIGCVIVKGGDDKFGIVTDRDVALRVVNRCLNPERTPVDEIMTQNPVLTLRDNMGALLQPAKSTGFTGFFLDTQGRNPI